MSGKIFGGQQAVGGAVVTVWMAGTSGYGAGATALATTRSDANGNFQFPVNAYTCSYGNAPVYVTAQGGDAGSGANSNLVLAAGIGPCSTAPSQFVDINEVTTAVTAFALGHFFTTTLGGAPTTDLFGGSAAGSGVYNTGLVQANSHIIPTLANLASGQVNPNTGGMSLEAAKIYTIANVLASCVNSAGQTSATEVTTSCGKLFSYTTPPGGTRPADTLQAAVQMCLYPYQNVTNLFNLSVPASPFVGLATAPNDWTVGVSYQSPAFGLAISGSATSGSSSTIDIDAAGRVWFASNTSGAHGLAYFDPSSLTFNGPYATGLGNPQYLAIDTTGTVWGTDLNANQVVGVLANSPAAVTTIATPAGGTTGPIAITSSTSGSTTTAVLLYSSMLNGVSTLYGAANGTSMGIGTYVGTPTGLTAYYGGPSTPRWGNAATSGASGPCRLETQTTNTPYSGVDATSATPCLSGGAVEVSPVSDEATAVASSQNQLCSYRKGTCFAPTVPLNLPEGIAIDGDSNVWIANSGNGSVSTLQFSLGFDSSTNKSIPIYGTTSPVAYLHDGLHGATMSKPYGIAIDRSGNVWVANAGCVMNSAAACTAAGFTLSELVGAGAPTLTPIAVQTINFDVGYRPSQYANVPAVISTTSR